MVILKELGFLTLTTNLQNNPSGNEDDRQSHIRRLAVLSYVHIVYHIYTFKSKNQFDIMRSTIELPGLDCCKCLRHRGRKGIRTPIS